LGDTAFSLCRNMKNLVPVAAARCAAPGVLLSLVLTACAPGGPREATYISVQPERAAKLREEMASLVAKEGMKPYVLSVSPYPGEVEYMIEADGNGLRVWFQAMPLSGQEDPSICGPSDGTPHSDPSQHFFYVERKFLWSHQEDAEAMQSGLEKKLRERGYHTYQSPALCGKAALSVE